MKKQVQKKSRNVLHANELMVKRKMDATVQGRNKSNAATAAKRIH